jgi:hypothetical protein
VSSQVFPGYPERKRNVFHDNDFSLTKLIDVDFRGGIDLTDQILPAGNDYILIKNTCRAAGILKEMRERSVDPVEKKLIHTVGSMLELDCSTGQTSQLLCTSEWGVSGNSIKQRLSA